MREPRKLPVVLSADEVVLFLESVSSLKSRAALTTAYAAGSYQGLGDRGAESDGHRQQAGHDPGPSWQRRYGNRPPRAAITRRPAMAPTQRLNDRTRPPIGLVEPVGAAIDAGLQNACEALQMPLGMFAGVVPRGVIERRRRILAAKWPNVADVGPNAAKFGLALRQDRNGGVVAVQTLSRRCVPRRSRHKGPFGRPDDCIR